MHDFCVFCDYLIWGSNIRVYGVYENLEIHCYWFYYSVHKVSKVRYLILSIFYLSLQQARGHTRIKYLYSITFAEAIYKSASEF